MHLRRHAHCRVKLNRCFNMVRLTLKLRMVHVLSFLGVELGCFSFIPNEATRSAGFYEEKFSFELNRTCFMPTSQFLYCMSRVLRRKSFSISSTRGHNTLYHICMKTAFIVVLSFWEPGISYLYVCSLWPYTEAGKINCILCFKQCSCHCFLFICFIEHSGLKQQKCSDISK